jgi:hypothetical protein
MVTLFIFKIEIKTLFLSMLVQVGEMLGNPQTVDDDGEVADVPSITKYFVPFDQLPNLEDDV